MNRLLKARLWNTHTLCRDFSLQRDRRSQGVVKRRREILISIKLNLKWNWKLSSGFRCNSAILWIPSDLGKLRADCELDANCDRFELETDSNSNRSMLLSTSCWVNSAPEDMQKLQNNLQHRSTSPATGSSSVRQRWWNFQFQDYQRFQLPKLKVSTWSKLHLNSLTSSAPHWFCWWASILVLSIQSDQPLNALA